MIAERLTAISPIDGRYASKLEALRPLCSEWGLLHYRVRIELAWFDHLSQQDEIAELPPLSSEDRAYLERLAQGFSVEDAEAIKEIERKTQHDVKAVEYFLKQHFNKRPSLQPYSEFLHFACTSEDINNLAYALMLRDLREKIWLPALRSVIEALRARAHAYAAIPMLARTHGQPASPTTLGKEIANTVARLRDATDACASLPLRGKMNGAVGCYHAHTAAYPALPWPSICRAFVEKLGLSWNAYTTQIEPHDAMAALFHAMSRCHTILIDFCRDTWGYISLGYYRQRRSAQEVGSSTMPHKINPIDFENAEGNLGLANALLDYLAAKLPISRWQRDLTDSTTLRNLGVPFAHSLVALDALQRGIAKLDPDPLRLQADLDASWAVLAEAIQTVMRRYRLDAPYERLKDITQGQTVNQEKLHAFLHSLPLPDTERDALLALTPASYIGLAAELARSI